MHPGLAGLHGIQQSTACTWRSPHLTHRRNGTCTVAATIWTARTWQRPRVTHRRRHTYPDTAPLCTAGIWMWMNPGLTGLRSTPQSTEHT